MAGTTLDVCKDTGRRGRGFDVSPFRPDVEQADARKLPVPTGSAALVFIDPTACSATPLWRRR